MSLRVSDEERPKTVGVVEIDLSSCVCCEAWCRSVRQCCGEVECGCQAECRYIIVITLSLGVKLADSVSLNNGYKPIK